MQEEIPEAAFEDEEIAVAEEPAFSIDTDLQDYDPFSKLDPATALSADPNKSVKNNKQGVYWRKGKAR